MTIGTSTDDISAASRWASFYRARGMNPLPSRADAKRPLVRFRHFWDEPAPASLFDAHPTANIQIMTGRRWRLLVIDLDGPEARTWWDRLSVRTPRTWATHSGGGGLHLWFRLPADYPTPLPKGILWKGDGDHSAVERLCDRSLVMAPPSIHPTTGTRYRFLDRSQSPVAMPMPAPCPGWLLAMPTVRSVISSAPLRRASARPLAPGSGTYRAADVVEAIPDKIALAKEWGVRFASDSGREWVPCHAIEREDSHPSAAVSRRTGAYVDLGSGTKLGLFDLAAALGVAHDWREAVAALGDRFRARSA